MTDATTIDTSITPPPEVLPTKMKSHRYVVPVYEKALKFSKEDGGLQHVMNELLRRYVENKEAQHAAAAKPPTAAKRGSKTEPVAEKAYDPFA